MESALQQEKGVSGTSSKALGAGSAAGAASGAAVGAATAATSKSADDTAKPTDGVPAPVAAFTEQYNICAEIRAKAKELDPVLEEQAVHLQNALGAQRDFIAVALRAKKTEPSDPAFQKLFQRISEHAEKAINVRESNRGSKYVNHLATIAESVPALGWITFDKPVDYISDFRDSAQYYANRVLKEYRGVDERHVTWINDVTKGLAEFQNVVGRFFPEGFTWKEDGVPLEEAVKSLESAAGAAAPAPAAPAAPAGGPAPPPPPPPMPPAEIFSGQGDSSASGNASSEPSGMGAVFSELNKGESVTAGLRKVDPSMQTHKNPELRSQRGPTPPEKKAAPPPPSKKPAALSMKKKAPPKKELVNNKWIIENFENEHELVIEGEMNQTVFIDRCSNCTIQITGKVNAVSITECQKTGVMVEDLVSSVEIIKSTGFGLQATGTVPTVSIDQSDNGNLYFNKNSFDVEIITAQTSSLNVTVIKSDDGDFDELPVPEQIVHKITPDGRLQSSILEHAG